MIRTLQDNELIYSFLEERSKLPLVFDRDLVFGFDDIDDFCLVAYVSSKRDFVLFTAENFVQNKDVLVELIDLIQGLEPNFIGIEMQQHAMQIVDDKLHSKNNSSFFFDAH